MKSVSLMFFMVLVLSGCNPYQGLYPEPSQTATPAVSVSAETPLQSTGGQPDPTPRPSCTVTTGIPSGSLNIRAGAGMQYAAIGLLHEGDVVTILTPGAWLEVETSQHQTGWINSKFCK